MTEQESKELHCPICGDGVVRSFYQPDQIVMRIKHTEIKRLEGHVRFEGRYFCSNCYIGFTMEREGSDGNI